MEQSVFTDNYGKNISFCIREKKYKQKIQFFIIRELGKYI